MVKNNIRKSLLEQGLTLSEKFILSSNNQIQEKFLEYLSTLEFKKILLYSPYKNEIRLDLVLKKLNEMQDLKNYYDLLSSKLPTNCSKSLASLKFL